MKIIFEVMEPKSGVFIEITVSKGRGRYRDNHWDKLSHYMLSNPNIRNIQIDRKGDA